MLHSPTCSTESAVAAGSVFDGSVEASVRVTTLHATRQVVAVTVAATTVAAVRSAHRPVTVTLCQYEQHVMTSLPHTDIWCTSIIFYF